MKPIVPAIIFLLFVASCMPYQYLTFNAERTTKDRDKSITWENDSIKLSYRFSQPGKLDITAFNKTKEPVYINWKRSAIIQDGRSVSLFDPGVQVTGNITRDNDQVRSAQQTSTISASFTISEGMDFMPPQTYVSRQGIGISEQLSRLVKLDANIPEQKIKDDAGNKISYRKQTYNAVSSPLRFRLYLTLGIGNDHKEFSVEHLFYVSELTETDNGPQAIFMKESEGDKLYTRVKTN